MKHVFFIVCLTACVDTPPTSLDENSRVTVFELPGYGPPELDLLFVIDSSAAMAPYQDRMAALPSILEQAYLAIGDGIVDVRIAVTTDGTLRRVASVGGSFIAIRTELDLARITNTTGTLLEALTPLTDVGTQSFAPNQPLAIAARVIAENPDGFIRSHAPLGIVIISASEDASPESPPEYARQIKETKPDPNTYVVGITAPSPRLDAFFASFPNHSFSAALADGDLLAALSSFQHTIKTILPGICFHASDVDPETPGPQYDCTVTAMIRDVPRLLPPCRVGDDQFCWSLEDSSNECQGFDRGFPPLKPRMPPYHFFTFVPAFRMECVVTD